MGGGFLLLRGDVADTYKIRMMLLDHGSLTFTLHIASNLFGSHPNLKVSLQIGS